jgi:hypothetical protein
VVLFNLIEPTGWKVGAVRVLDVATGCLVAVVVSLVFWPRGARLQVRRALDELFATVGAYLGACFERVLSATVRPEPDAERAAALACLRRARDALGDLLEERGPASPDTVAAMRRFATALGVRISAERVDELAPVPFHLVACPDAAGVVRAEAVAVADALAAARPCRGAAFDAERGTALAGCLAEWGGADDEARCQSALTLVWVSQWVVELNRLSRRLDGLPAGVGVVAADGPGRGPGGDAVVGQIAGDDRAGGHHDMAADAGAGQHDRAVPEP